MKINIIYNIMKYDLYHNVTINIKHYVAHVVHNTTKNTIFLDVQLLSSNCLYYYV